jgi:hypothetical protein
MSVNVKQPDADQTTMNVGTPPPKPQPQASFRQSASDLVFGLNSKLAAFGGGGEYFDKLFTKFEEKVKLLNDHLKGTEKYNLHKLIKTNAGLNYSAVLVSEKSEDLIVFHLLMIERTGDYPTALFENLGGTRYEIMRTPADALDDKYLAQATKLIGDSYGVNPNSVVSVDSTLVPNEFNVENDTAVHDLFINTINALDGEINVRGHRYGGINIPGIVGDGRRGKFVVNMYFNSNEAHLINEAGMPVRQDICVALSYKLNSANNDRSVNQGNDTVDIVKTFGYIDFQWVGPTQAGNMMATQCFIPNFVITRIESNFIPTPDITLLGVASVLSINEDMNWMQAFKATTAKKGEVDFTDIGALNIEGNIEKNTTGYGKKVNTKDKEFTLTVLNTLVNQLVYPNIIISIDVAQASPDTWYENVFYYAGKGDTFEANRRIIDSIRNMTNSVVDIPANLPIFSPMINKVHGGYYKTKDGIKDLRQLSTYLSIANFAADSGQDPKIISEYTNSFHVTSIPAEIRAAERKKFIDNMSNNTAVYKQAYNRLTFTSVFMGTLVNSLKQSGFSPVFGNMMTNNDMFFRRATADFSSSVLGNDMRLISNTNAFNNFYQPSGYNRTF